jgi:GH15 family glucan-1,4-alpha-glucosidase
VCHLTSKIRRILKISKSVIRRHSLGNGAIVASNPKDPDYPKGAKNYFYVWPRDASFACVACDLIGIRKIPEKFFNWCWDVENFKDNGKLYMRYHTDGRMYGRQFQPDQAGALLWALQHHSRVWKTDKFNDLVDKVADGICSSWNGKCFGRSYDMWEEKIAFPKKMENFTYSLAINIKGLEAAMEIVGTKPRWSGCVDQMRQEIKKSYDAKTGCFARKFNGDFDRTVDSSLLGLVWPSGLIKPKNPAMQRTVSKILETNSTEDGGIMRYRGDRYAGFLKRKEGGTWPVLNFWLSIYYTKARDRKKALKYFNWVIERVEGKLPEQIKDGKPASINPLVWSHSMFIIAGKLLELF